MKLREISEWAIAQPEIKDTVWTIYEALVKRRLVRCQTDFSTDWLRRTEWYYHHSDKTPSRETLLNLYITLNDAAQIDLADRVLALLFEVTRNEIAHI